MLATLETLSNDAIDILLAWRSANEFPLTWIQLEPYLQWGKDYDRERTALRELCCAKIVQLSGKSINHYDLVDRDVLNLLDKLTLDHNVEVASIDGHYRIQVQPAENGYNEDGLNIFVYPQETEPTTITFGTGQRHWTNGVSLSRYEWFRLRAQIDDLMEVD